MRAVVYDRYGPPDVLRVEDIPVPVPGPSQVLVEIASTSVNLSDWEGLRGSPLYARIGGLRAPARRVLGSDIAGRVAAVGANVGRFRVGDDVYGDNLGLAGGFAEYAVAPEAMLAHKPEGLSFAESSTVPQAGSIALQGTASARPGQRVLVNGAGGGAGTFAIQLAALAGAHVTGVDNTCVRSAPSRRSTIESRTSPGSSRSTSCSIWSPTDPCSPTGARSRPAAAISASAAPCRR
jgi:NADPH:quinone reductase-like Zn-dependent oxidoreductase